MRIELTTSAWKAEVLPLNYTRKWRETESNRRHMELQSIALPTELPSQKCNSTINCGSRIWTYDLRVMSPTSYLAAPSRDNKKEDVGFEPTHGFTRLTVFKTVPFSRTWVILQKVDLVGFEPTTARLWAESSNQLS